MARQAAHRRGVGLVVAVRGGCAGGLWGVLVASDQHCQWLSPTPCSPVLSTDRHELLPLWLDLHLGALGASRAYVYDLGSEPPLDAVLAPFMRTGSVAYRCLPAPRRAAADLEAAVGRRPDEGLESEVAAAEAVAFALALRDHGPRHEWLGALRVGEA